MSLYAYNYIPRCGRISQKFLLLLCISALTFVCTIYLFINLFAVLFAHIATMAESNQGIWALRTGDVQSILEG